MIGINYGIIIYNRKMQRQEYIFVIPDNNDNQRYIITTSMNPFWRSNTFDDISTYRKQCYNADEILFQVKDELSDFMENEEGIEYYRVPLIVIKNQIDNAIQLTRPFGRIMGPNIIKKRKKVPFDLDPLSYFTQ